MINGGDNMNVSVGDSFWSITELYPEAPEECRVLRVHDDNTFDISFVDSDVYENCTEKDPFVLYDSYEKAELVLIESIYNALRYGNKELVGEYNHVKMNDNESTLFGKYEQNYSIIKELFNSVYNNVIQCYMTAMTCHGSLRVYIDEVNGSIFNRLIVRHPFRTVTVINNYVIDPDIVFFPLSMKKYKWMLSKLNQGKEVFEIESMHRIVSWEKEVI